MSQLRFKHVFMALMGLSVLSGFVLPERLAGKAQPQLQALFAPVARPAGALGIWAQNHIAPDRVRDNRSTDEIRRENVELKTEFINLSALYSELQRENGERQKLGVLRDLCTPVAVVGPDAGGRESLSLAGSSLEGLREGMPVLYPGGVVGKLARAGIGGSQVMLVTDLGFRVRACFGQWHRNSDDQVEFVIIDTPPVLVEGSGHGTMMVRSLTVEQAKKLSRGNWVVLEERDWPARLKHQPLGKIEQIGRRRDAPQYAEIRIEPDSNLLNLREVMVMTKEQ
jgi:hypothetical protein